MNKVLKNAVALAVVGGLSGCAGMTRDDPADRMVYTKIDPAQAEGFSATIGTYMAPCGNDRTQCSNYHMLFARDKGKTKVVDMGDDTGMHGGYYVGGKVVDVLNNWIGRAITGEFNVEASKEYAQGLKKSGSTVYSDERVMVITDTDVGVGLGVQTNNCASGGCGF